MALKAIDILKALNTLGGIGVAAFTRTPGMMNLVGSSGYIPQGIASGRRDTSKGASVGDVAYIADQHYAKEYPREFYPNREGHTVNITSVGPDVHNAMLNAAIAEKAARMQTKEEHNSALLKYIRPRMNPSQLHEAIQRGIEEEKNLDSYWADSKPRKEYSPSSSAVSSVRITPDGRIEVAWASKPGKYYTFRQFADTHEASLEAQKLLMCDSLGRAVMPAKIAQKSKKGGNLGWWNTRNYDGSFAK